MDYSTPEKEGIRSEWIKEYIEVLESSNLSTHSIIIMRHGRIVFENYRAPFTKDSLHRMYSVSKSFVALAIGFLEQDGKISLDDTIAAYFPKELKHETDRNVTEQTIRDMLMMATARPPEKWFSARPSDRVAYYFESKAPSHPSGTVFHYDSTGSFILGALVERVTGKPITDYLREKLFDKIGVSKDAYMLKCPGGHSWSDSALLCTSRDLLKTAMFCMQGGKVNGEQILNEQFIADATSKQIDNDVNGTDDFDKQGYGYQIWRTYDNSYFFNGMGCQFAICVPDKDIIMVYTADNQGNPVAKKVIFDNFFNMIVRRATSEIPESPFYSELLGYAKTLELFTAKGKTHSKIANRINGKTYVMDKNPMGITKMKLCFDDGRGVLYYTNAQGDKEIPFGICKNEFAPFPQRDYSDEIGSVKGDRLYNCAASAAWVSDYQLFIKVQIIDTYLGNLNINIGFRDDKIGVKMEKAAEDFLDEYQGFAGGRVE